MRKIVLLIFISISLITFLSAQTQSKLLKKHKNSITKSSKQSNNSKLNSAKDSKTIALSSSSLSKIKAVLVVAPAESTTQNSIKKVEVIAIYLKSIGVNVKELYDKNATWTNIVREAKEANIFLYCGHGSNLGVNKRVGGLCLFNNEFITSNTIIKELRLHKNALVLFHTVCNAAGSSASDNADIGIKEATQRVSDYAHPFVLIGAAGFYANNWDNTMVPFLKEFFNKKNIKQIYTKNASSFCNIELFEKYMYEPTYEISISSFSDTSLYTKTTYINGVAKKEEAHIYKNYGIAYVGKPDFTVLDFFK